MPPPTAPNPAYDNYSNHINGTNLWGGSNSLATRYYGSAYNAVEMGPCAYDFRLVVDKRTTNGYGLIYVGYEYDFTIVITRSIGNKRLFPARGLTGRRLRSSARALIFMRALTARTDGSASTASAKRAILS